MEKKQLVSAIILALCAGASFAAPETGDATTAMGPAVTTNSFVTLDKDKDNLVSKDEVANVVTPSMEFGAADGDKDGKLNMTEFKSYINETHTPAASGMTEGMMAAPPAGMDGHHAGMEGHHKMMSFEDMDANKDGELSRDEYGSGDKAHPHGHGDGHDMKDHPPCGDKMHKSETPAPAGDAMQNDAMPAPEPAPELMMIPIPPGADAIIMPAPATPPVTP